MNSTFNLGYGSSVAPTYINEVSPKHLRGTLGASFQLGIVVILFFSQAISLQPVLGSKDLWHYALGNDYFVKKGSSRCVLLGLPIVFSVIQVLLLFLVPESPKYLLLKKNNSIGAEKGWFYF